MNNIFISYRREDSADSTGRISDSLVENFESSKIFMDVDDIPLGVDFAEHLDDVVSKCEVLLAIIGRDWVDASSDDGKKRLSDPNDFVRIEIESALTRGVPVIPILVRGASMPTKNDLPVSLRGLVTRNGMPVRPGPDYANDINKLSSSLEKHLGIQKPRESKSPSVEKESILINFIMAVLPWIFFGFLAIYGARFYDTHASIHNYDFWVHSSNIFPIAVWFIAAGVVISGAVNLKMNRSIYYLILLIPIYIGVKETIGSGFSEDIIISLILCTILSIINWLFMKAFSKK